MRMLVLVDEVRRLFLQDAAVASHVPLVDRSSVVVGHCVCACVCVWCARTRGCVCVRVRMSVCPCVRARTRACDKGRCM